MTQSKKTYNPVRKVNINETKYCSFVNSKNVLRSQLYYFNSLKHYLRAMSADSSSDEQDATNIIYISDERPEWTDESTRELLRLYYEKIDMYIHGKIPTHKKVWEAVSIEMMKMKFQFSPAHCINKWITLKRTYKTRCATNKNNQIKRHHPYQSEMDKIFSIRPEESPIKPEDGKKSILHFNGHDSYKVNFKLQNNMLERNEWTNNDIMYQNNIKRMKMDSNSDDDDDEIFRINFNEISRYPDTNEEVSHMSTPDRFIVQESGPLIEELSQLRETMSKSARFQAHLLKQSTELQKKIEKHLENSAQRETNSLILQKAMVEQQNEIIKQMKLQSSLLQKLLDKIG